MKEEGEYTAENKVLLSCKLSPAHTITMHNNPLSPVDFISVFQLKNTSVSQLSNSLMLTVTPMCRYNLRRQINGDDGTESL